MSDHSDFRRAAEEFDEWHSRASGSVHDASSVAEGAAGLTERVEQLKDVTARMTEGQHLLNCVNKSFAGVAGVTPEKQVAAMREEVKLMKARYDALAVEASEALSELQRLQQRWQDVRGILDGVASWVSDTRPVLAEAQEGGEDEGSGSGGGEVGEMKTMLDRFKDVAAEVQKKKGEVEAARAEAADLPRPAREDGGDLLAAADALTAELAEFESLCASIASSLESEISEQSEYQRAAQETEKWLLQMSFQLMAHNSLYITTRDQTQEQIVQHEKLMEEIKAFQANLDAVREKGHAQVAKHSRRRPDLKSTVERQHQNYQENYNSLLQTGTQIKNRLYDSLAKFQEYEDALDNIIRNLESLEPQIRQSLDRPVEEVEDLQKEYDNFRVSIKRVVILRVNSVP